MAEIQTYFIEFHDKIKLGVYDENKTLREKRDVIIKKIKEGIKKHYEDEDDKAPDLEFFDQGSYKLGTGINPENDEYDIDEGVIFNLLKDDYDDPVEFKILIRNIMNSHTSTPVKIKNPCVTITYSEGSEPAYHVDLPVYLRSYDSRIYLSRGKEYSDMSNRVWEESDPKGLNEYILDKFKDDNRAQLRRIVRYLKKWKDVRFKAIGNTTPPSIGITLDVVEMFNPYKQWNAVKNSDEYVDLVALKDFVGNLKNSFHQIYDANLKRNVHVINRFLPKEPYSDVYGKMSNNQMDNYYNEACNLYDALNDAYTEADPHVACSNLTKYFGSDFPVPESTDARYRKKESHGSSSYSG